MKAPSITTRILISAALPAVLVTLLLSGYLTVQRVGEIRAVEIERAAALLEGLARAGEFGIATGNTALLESIGRSALGSEAIRRVRFDDANGDTLATVMRDLHGVPPADAPGSLGWWWPDVETDRRLAEPVMLTDLSEFDDPLLEPEQDTAGGRRIGEVSLELDLSTAFARQTRALWRGLWIALLVLLFALLAAWRLARSVSEPIHRLHDAIGELAQRRYVSRLPVSAGGEIGDLSRAVLHLSNESRAFHGGLEAATRAATSDLRAALATLEARNRELSDARAQAERANLAKSQFLASMSHEIRTPMHAIVGTLSTLRHSTLDADQRAQLDLVERSSTTLLTMLDDVLDLSRIEAGHLQLDDTPFDLGDLLQEVEWTHAGAARSRGLRLDIGPIPGRDRVSVVADPLRLKQVLFNLLGNAIKFTDEGSVTLTVARHAPASGTAATPWWRFSVIDTGMGIAHHRLASVCEPFQQADMSMTRRFGGAGLGLHICREIVTRMGGTLELRSVEGEGTRVDVNLPLPTTRTTPAARNRLTDRSPAEGVRPPGQGREAGIGHAAGPPTSESPHVLAVDDQAINLALLKRYFEHLEVRATLVRSAEEAYEALNHDRFELLLLDLHMPDSDGFEIAAAVREGGAWNARVPILALTADAFLSTRERALAAGFDDVLVKPVTVERVGAALARWTGRPGRPTECSVSLERTAQAAAGDMEWARGALDTFDKEVPGHIGALEKGLRDKDRDALFHAAHAIKGVSAVLRIEPSGGRAARLSLSARTAEWHEIRHDTERLIEAMMEASAACRAASTSESA